MKMNIFTIAAILFASFTFISCNDDDDKSEAEKLIDYPYSTLTLEQQKEKLAKDAESTVQLLADLPNEKSYQLLESLDYYMEYFGIEGSNEDMITQLSKYKGSYSWNNNRWVLEEGTEKADSLILLFPAQQGTDNNNGNLILREEKNIGSTVVELYTNHVKEGLITLTVGNKESLNSAISAKLGKYILTGSNTASDANFSVLKGDTTIIKGAFNIDAKITQEDIENSDSIPLLINRGNVTINMSNNIAFAGYAKIKDLNAALENAQDTVQTIAAYNKYISIALVSTKEEYKIADVVFEYVVIEGDDRDTNGDGKIDEKDEKNIEGGVEPFLQFKDGSKVAPEVYFGKGFDVVEEMINNIFSK